QMVINNAITRPTNPVLGQVSYVITNDDFHYCSNSIGPVWSSWRSRILYNTSTSALSTTTTTFVKDTGCSDLAFSVLYANDFYRIRYIARANSDAATTTVDFRIYDGGASSPTTSSTQIAGATMYLDIAAGAGTSQLICETVLQLSAGTHTVAAFYGRAAGTGNVKADQSASGARFLYAEQLPWVTDK